MGGISRFTWLFDGSRYVGRSVLNGKRRAFITSLAVEKGDFVSYVKAEPYESKNAVTYRIAEEIENGLSQKHYNKSQAAQILGVDRSYFTYIINGKKTPSPEMAKRIGLCWDSIGTYFTPERCKKFRRSDLHSASREHYGMTIKVENWVLTML